MSAPAHTPSPAPKTAGAVQALALFSVCCVALLLLLWGSFGLRGEPGPASELAAQAVPEHPAPLREPAPDAGRMLYLSSCASCHGVRGQGVPRQGLALGDSPLLRDGNEEALLAFLIAGRPADDPDSQMQLPMPPRAGNPWLTDAELRLTGRYAKLLVAESN